MQKTNTGARKGVIEWSGENDLRDSLENRMTLQQICVKTKDRQTKDKPSLNRGGKTNNTLLIIRRKKKELRDKAAF